jgi:catechol-2,3-dioxygenase
VNIQLAERLVRENAELVDLVRESRAEILRLREIEAAVATFAENHGSYHPDFWLADRRGKGEWCASCDLCAGYRATTTAEGVPNGREVWL